MDKIIKYIFDNRYNKNYNNVINEPINKKKPNSYHSYSNYNTDP